MRVIMVKNRFAPMILSGRKPHTIRKKARCVPGDTLSIRRWAGKPYVTPQLKVSDAWCTALSGIVVARSGIYIDLEPLGIDEATSFAWHDGFDSLGEMIDFFNCQYSLPFKGVVIEFTLFKNHTHASDGVPCANSLCKFHSPLFVQSCARAVTYDVEEPFAPVCPKYLPDIQTKAGEP